MKNIIAQLIKGNKIFTVGEPKPINYCFDSSTSTQKPKAVVITCSDSRVPVEHIFGVGIGELFVIRNAGNVVSTSVLASVQYAVEYLDVKTVIVMGHTNCGAISAIPSLHSLKGDLKLYIDKLDKELVCSSDTFENIKHNIHVQAEKIVDKNLDCSVYEALYVMEKGIVEIL